MNDRIRLQAISGHNYRRSRLARGLVKNKNGRPLPTAANMVKLRYRCLLETTAKAAADSCSTSWSRVPYGVQQNIICIPKGEARYRVHAITEAIKRWWRRVRFDQFGVAVMYRYQHQFTSISWFTRMAWATTRYLGCAVSDCGHQWCVVCHYRPGGNIVGQYLYERGNPCSRCPIGFFCDSSMLCAAITR
ncbi:SCP-like protein [Ostertagia ostertagi]